MHRIGIAAWITLGLTGLMCMPGCNIATPVAYVIYGPGKVQAKHELSPELATVVFVDDPSGRIVDRRLRDLMAQTATTMLMNRAKMLDMINPQSVLTVASKDSYSNPLSITEVGKAVGADVVIYVVINDFSLEGPGGSSLPSATIAVKVLDVKQEERVWPTGSEGTFIRIGGDYRPGISPKTSADRVEAEENLAAKTGLGISQLFFLHEITESVIH